MRGAECSNCGRTDDAVVCGECDGTAERDEEIAALRTQLAEATAALRAIASGLHDRDPLSCAVDVDGTERSRSCARGCGACVAKTALARLAGEQKGGA